MLVVTAIGIEGLLQAFYYLTAGDFLFRRGVLPLFEPDPTRCFRLKSELAYSHRTNEFDVTVFTNSQGHRTDQRRLEVPHAKPPGAYRILFLGPSLTFGWGNEFEEAYPTLLGEALRASGAPVEVLNLGTPAQQPSAQLCWLRAEGYRFEPDAIVQTIYGDRIPPVAATCPEELQCPAVVEGKLYNALPTLRLELISWARNLASVFYGYYLFQTLRPGGDAPEGTGKELYGEAEREGDLAPSELAEQYRSFGEFAARVTGRATPVVFLYIPLSYAVHPSDAPRWRHILNPDPEATRQRIRTGLAALRDAGITVIDTTGPLIEAAHRERMYYWLDIHLTPAGNRVVSEAALPRLTALLAARAGPDQL